MENFQEKISQNQLVVVDFNADWCSPCRKLEPVFQALAKQHPECRFISVDVDDNEEIANNYSINSLPTVVLFREGKEMKRIVGYQPDSLKKAVINNAF